MDEIGHVRGRRVTRRRERESRRMTHRQRWSQSGGGEEEDRTLREASNALKDAETELAAAETALTEASGLKKGKAAAVAAADARKQTAARLVAERKGVMLEAAKAVAALAAPVVPAAPAAPAAPAKPIPGENALTTSPLDPTVWADVLPDKFKFLTAPIDVTDKTIPTKYITLVANQDELLLKVVELAYKKFGLDKDNLEISKFLSSFGAISGAVTKSELTSNLKTLLNKIYLAPILAGKNGTKLYNIIQGTVNDPIGSLLLYPARVTNIFIKALATIFVQIKSDKDSKDDILTPINLSNTILKGIITRHYESHVNSAAYTLTGTEIRDFISILNTSTFSSKNISVFFDQFITTIGTYLARTPTLFETKDAEGCSQLTINGAFEGTPAEDDVEAVKSAATIAASLLIDYINVPKETSWDVVYVLNKLKLTGDPTCSKDSIEKKVATRFVDLKFSETQLNEPIEGTNGVTLNMLFRQMNYPSFYFILQLVQAVVNVEKEQEELKRAAATTA